MAKKGKRDFKFSVAELEHMLDIIDDIVPIGNPDWEKVWQEHSAAYSTMERTQESLKRKFQELVRKKNPTGDPNCPPYVCKAKRISRKIVIATDGSTGGSSVAAESIASDEDGGGAENGMDEIGMDEEEDKDAEEVEVGVNPPIPPPIIRGNLLHSIESAGYNNDEGEINSSHPTNDDDACRDPSAAAAMQSSQAHGGGEKRKAGDGANLRRSRTCLRH
jgi:hypothetical protein